MQVKDPTERVENPNERPPAYTIAYFLTGVWWSGEPSLLSTKSKLWSYIQLSIGSSDGQVPVQHLLRVPCICQLLTSGQPSTPPWRAP